MFAVKIIHFDLSLPIERGLSAEKIKYCFFFVKSISGSHIDLTQNSLKSLPGLLLCCMCLGSDERDLAGIMCMLSAIV